MSKKNRRFPGETKEERKVRIISKRVKRARKFKGKIVTPENRLRAIREQQLKLMEDGMDPEIAYLLAKKAQRREQKHLKAYLKGNKEFKFGTHIVTDNNGKDKEEPLIIQVL